MARVSARNGRALWTGGPYATRELGRDAGFAARPTATIVSTSKAYNGRDTHSDIRWHTNPTHAIRGGA